MVEAVRELQVPANVRCPRPCKRSLLPKLLSAPLTPSSPPKRTLERTRRQQVSAPLCKGGSHLSDSMLHIRAE